MQADSRRQVYRWLAGSGSQVLRQLAAAGSQVLRQLARRVHKCLGGWRGRIHKRFSCWRCPVHRWFGRRRQAVNTCNGGRQLDSQVLRRLVALGLPVRWHQSWKALGSWGVPHSRSNPTFTATDSMPGKCKVVVKGNFRRHVVVGRFDKGRRPNQLYTIVGRGNYVLGTKKSNWSLCNCLTGGDEQPSCCNCTCDGVEQHSRFDRRFD